MRRVRPRNWKGPLERTGLPLVWLALIVFFGWLQPAAFLSGINVSSMLGWQAPLVVLTLGLLIPLTAGDLDMSVASTMTLSSTVIAVLNVSHQWPILPALLVVLVIGALVGLLNAVFILFFRIHSLIVTLSVATFISGVVLMVGDLQTTSGVSEGLIS